MLTGFIDQQEIGWLPKSGGRLLRKAQSGRTFSSGWCHRRGSAPRDE